MLRFALVKLNIINSPNWAHYNLYSCKIKPNLMISVGSRNADSVQSFIIYNKWNVQILTPEV